MFPNNCQKHTHTGSLISSTQKCTQADRAEWSEDMLWRGCDWGETGQHKVGNRDSNERQNQIKSNQITFIVTSPQHKCLGEWNSYERAPDSAEKQQTIYIWTDSAKKQQTIYLWTDSAKKQQTIYLWTDSAKKQQTIYLWTDSAKKNNKQFTYGQTVQKKLHWSIYSAPDSAKTTIYIWTDSAKKTTTIYIWTDSAKKTTTAIYIWTDSAKNNSNLHMDSTYLQTVQKTMCKIHIHILSTLSVL